MWLQAVFDVRLEVISAMWLMPILGEGRSLVAVPWLLQSPGWRPLYQLAPALLLSDMFVFLRARLPFKALNWGYKLV